MILSGISERRKRRRNGLKRWLRRCIENGWSDSRERRSATSLSTRKGVGSIQYLLVYDNSIPRSHEISLQSVFCPAGFLQHSALGLDDRIKAYGRYWRTETLSITDTYEYFIPVHKFHHLLIFLFLIPSSYHNNFAHLCNIPVCNSRVTGKLSY